MEKNGILSKVTKPTDWCAPMVVVTKPSGDVRITTDFTVLNQAVRRERFEMPSVDFTLGKLGGSKFFSKLDANSGFYQITLDKGSRDLTAFITPFGRFCYNRLPMGISSAPEVFSREMQHILEGIDGVSNLVDDVCVFGSSKEEHDSRLTKVLDRLREAGVTLNLEKCVFGASSLKYLGFLISEKGVHPDPDKVVAISQFPAPTDVSGVRRFLGLVNNLARFIPNLSTIIEPIRSLLRKDTLWCWDSAQSAAFEKVKEILTSPEVLVLYDSKRETCVSADSSSYGLGAVLLQKVEDVWRPVSYISRSLTETESRYAPIEKEALAVVWSCERFNQYLLGSHFLIQTDHSPLVSLLSKKRLDDLPIRIQRFRLRLLRYSYDVQYVPGRLQTVADTLSRAPLGVGATVDEVHFIQEVESYALGVVESLPASKDKISEIRSLQMKDPILMRVREFTMGTWPQVPPLEARAYAAVRDELSIVDGLLVKGSRIVIPACMYAEMLAKLHEGHQGIIKCQRRARNSVWWPGITVQIKNLISRCNVCMQFRVQHAEPMVSTPLPTRPWQKIASDLFHFQGKKYLLVVDYFSRFIEIALLSSSNASTVLMHMKSIFARHGCPETMVTDGGPPYSSKEFRQFAAKYGFHHIFSSPEYPQGNSEAERAVQTIKELLKKAAVRGEDPYLALLAYRCTPLQNGYSPAQLLMGRNLNSPLPLLPAGLQPSLPNYGEIRCYEEQYKEKMATNYNSRKRARPLNPLKPGDKVHVQKKGTATVTEFCGNRSYKMVNDDGVSIRRNRRIVVSLQQPQKEKSATPEGTIKTENKASVEFPASSQPVLRRSQRSTQGVLPERYRD